MRVVSWGMEERGAEADVEDKAGLGVGGRIRGKKKKRKKIPLYPY